MLFIVLEDLVSPDSPKESGKSYIYSLFSITYKKHQVSPYHATSSVEIPSKSPSLSG